MNRIDSTIDQAQRLLADAQMLRQHFDEQKQDALRRAPRCENSRGGHGPTYEDAEECGACALDACVHCEAALCVECITEPCPETSGNHLPSRKAIDQAVEKLANKMRMVG